MRTSMIAALAAVGLLGMQNLDAPTTGRFLATPAHAAALDRYEGGATLQRNASPQRPQAFAQAEGSRGDATYGRRYSAGEQTGVDNGAFRQAAAESTGVDNGTYRQAAAESTGIDNGAYRQAAAESTGVDNGQPA